MSNILKGTVKWFNGVKGYGFLIKEDNSELFVHKSQLKDRRSGLFPGDIVEFTIGEGRSGPHAENVVKIGSGPAPVSE